MPFLRRYCLSVFCPGSATGPAFHMCAKKLRLFFQQCPGQRSQVRRIPAPMIQISQHGQPVGPFLLL